jgi:hypothetical protein
MTLDPVGANVSSSAVVVVLLFALMYAIAGSPLGRLIGIRPDYPFLFNPTGIRAISVVIAFPALLVAVWGLAYGLIAPHFQTTALPVQAGFAAAGGVLVLTAARFARFVTFIVGGRTAVEGELRPDEIVPVDEIGDDVDLAAALDAARRGEWEPAAALLRATGDVDVRADRIRAVTAQSVHDSQWIEEWFAARPTDPQATVVRAELAVQRAWAVRGGLDASHTPDEAIRAFFTGLEQAQRLAEKAIGMAPDDPMPWATLVQIARGQQVDQDEFGRRLEGLFERAPHHVYGSQVALQTVCTKWFGDTETMFAMARDLGTQAPAGSATCLLPLIAHIERHLELEGGRGGPSQAQRHMTAGATRTELRACVQRWMTGPDGGPRPGGRLEGHNLAAYAFWLADDADAARLHLAEIGRSVTEWPWGYSGNPGEVLGVARRWAGLPVVAPVSRPHGVDDEPFRLTWPES